MSSSKVTTSSTALGGSAPTGASGTMALTMPGAIRSVTRLSMLLASWEAVLPLVSLIVFEEMDRAMASPCLKASPIVNVRTLFVRFTL